MFTVPGDNCSKRGSPEAKAGGGSAGREQLLLLLLFFIQRKVIGVLEGLRGLPACVLHSPAPSSAVRAKRLSLQLAGRPKPRATGPAPAEVLGAGRAVAPQDKPALRSSARPSGCSCSSPEACGPLGFPGNAKQGVSLSGTSPGGVETAGFGAGFVNKCPLGPSTRKTLSSSNALFSPHHLYAVLPVARPRIKAETVVAIL